MLKFVIEETVNALIRDVLGERAGEMLLEHLDQPQEGLDGQRGMDAIVEQVQDSILVSMERHPWGTSLMSRSEVEHAAFDNWLTSFREFVPQLAETVTIHGAA